MVYRTVLSLPGYDYNVSSEQVWKRDSLSLPGYDYNVSSQQVWKRNGFTSDGQRIQLCVLNFIWQVVRRLQLRTILWSIGAIGASARLQTLANLIGCDFASVWAWQAPELKTQSDLTPRCQTLANLIGCDFASVWAWRAVVLESIPIVILVRCVVRIWVPHLQM